MGLFGKKKTPKEILAEGQAYYQQEKYGKAALVLLKASGKENGEVDYWLGRCYLAFDGDSSGNRKTAKSFLTYAARDGHEEAAKLLAEQFDVKDYLPEESVVTAEEAFDKGLRAYNSKSYPEALHWWKKAAKLGEVSAQYNIAFMYHSGEGTEKDETKALYWYREAAKGGHPDAQFNTGLYYLHGVATSVDKDEALKWFQLAAQQGQEDAQKQLTELMPASAPKAKTDEELCDEGSRAFGAEDYVAAAKIWLPLAEKGVSRAQDCMGLLYYRGDGVEKDDKKAAEWYRKAADQGRASSMFNLAIFYKCGIGVAEDLKEALRWAEKAKAAGSERADSLIAEIRHNIEEEENRRKEAVQATSKPVADAPTNTEAKTSNLNSDTSPVAQTSEEAYQRGEELRRSKDYDGAVQAWTQAAKQGHQEALKKLTGFYAGDLTVWGLRTKDIRQKYIDYDKAIEWGTTALKQGVDVAGTVMDAYKKKGMIEEAIVLGKKATEQGLNTEWKLMLFCLEAEMYEDAIFWCEKYDDKKGGLEAAEYLDQTSREAWNQGLTAYEKEDYVQALSCWKKAAGLEVTTAMYNCGFMYENGQGTTANRDEALGWYLKAAEQGNKNALERAASLGNAKSQYQMGDKCFKAGQMEEALEWFLKSAKQGYHKAQSQCGFFYQLGIGTESDVFEALYWYEKAEKDKDSTSIDEYISLMMEIFDPAVEMCNAGKPEGLQTILKLAQKEISIAQYAAANAYDKGIYTAVDKAKALYWYEKAAEQGDVVAQYKCGCMYDKGEGTEENKNKALYWYEKAAKQGDVNAQFKCGLMYYNGEGTEEDKAKALYWFEKAAGQNDIAAQFNCGVMYYNGHGTASDMAKALYWYEKAAEQGHKDAQFTCGIMYKNGDGTAADKAKALYWYEKAAEQGHNGAQYNCGEMYYNGEGTPQNKSKAKIWYEKCAEGNSEASSMARALLKVIL